MTTPTTIDSQAPVVARHEVMVNAPLERVWAAHLAVREWVGWQPDITGLMASADTLAPGVTFDWSSGGLQIHTTVYVVDRQRHETLWGGPAHGVTAVHHWVFTEVERGVRVQTEESWAGEAVGADVPRMQQALDASLIAWLGRLKGHAERSA